MMKEYRARYYPCITNIENSNWEKETVMDNIIDNFLINLGDTDGNSEDSSDGCSDTKEVNLFMSDLFLV
jgi:hypothetical protein